jgi:cytochrome c-type biogenesis protein CcmF
MAANLGYGSIVIAFFLSLYSGFMSVAGGRKKSTEFIESARLGLLLTFLLTGVSAGCLVYLLVNGRYDVQYVFSVVSNDMPVYLRVTALWGGQAGSLLFWSFLLAAYGSLVTGNHWDRDDEFLPWVLAVLSFTLTFFLCLSVFMENPFIRYWQYSDGSYAASMMQPEGAQALLSADGAGLNPLLRHLGMVLHPPMLYLGFTGFVIPFSYAIAALVTGRTDSHWIRITRRWTLISWLFLSLGLILGSRWAYDVLGWGGYWSWDPVEIAAFMPWLLGTAFLHSVISQEKMSLFKRWNMVLIILTYDMVIFGTFLTRSGVLSSVHAFSQSSIGVIFLVFITVSFSLSLGLLLWRWNILHTENPLRSLFSRESLFLFNNLVFMGIFLVCLWGVLYPVISEVFTGQKVTVGPPFYERATGPLFALLLFLMGIAPLTAWGFSTAKTLSRRFVKPLIAVIPVIVFVFAAGVRSAPAIAGLILGALVVLVIIYEYGSVVNARCKRTGEPPVVAMWRVFGLSRRRYGGYIIHIGVVMIALGIIGIEFFQTETQGTVARGQSLVLGSYTFTYRDITNFDTDDGRNIARAVINIKDGEKVLGEVYPRRDYYYQSQQPVTVPGVLSSPEEDLYVVLVDWQPINSQGATFKVYRNPLVFWLWIGGLIFMLGTLVAAWPDLSVDRERLVRLTARRAMEEAGK